MFSAAPPPSSIQPLQPPSLAPSTRPICPADFFTLPLIVERCFLIEALRPPMGLLIQPQLLQHFPHIKSGMIGSAIPSCQVQPIIGVCVFSLLMGSRTTALTQL